MEFLVPIALMGWIPVICVLFCDRRDYRTLISAYVAAWLFLPVAKLKIQHLPDCTKISATAVGMMLAIACFDSRRLLAFRLKWLDLPMVVFCFSPIVSALSNSLGLWDGFSNTLTMIMMWGVPYLCGRIYLDSFDKLTSLAKGIFVGGLVYIPFCLVELRMSPQFYSWVYGKRPVVHAARYGGWRPEVFLATGLELGMWMTAATLMGFALWYSGALRKLWGLPTGVLLVVLLAVTVLCKSTGALMLLIVGTGVLMMARWFRSPLPILCLIVVPLVYITVRIADLDDGRELVSFASSVFGPDRAQSLEFRFQNEIGLTHRALEAKWFGWGGWGREKVLDEYGESLSIVDGMWIINFGCYGLLGLLSWATTLILPPVLATRRFANRHWPRDQVIPLVALATLVLLYAIDCLLNSMPNPIYAVALGGLTTVTLLPRQRLLPSILEDDEPTVFEPALQRQFWPPPLPTDGGRLGPPATAPRSDETEPLELATENPDRARRGHELVESRH
jgi:hypothetical protein